MEKYVWLFPLLFIFHDMEEIIGFGIWGKRHLKELEKRFTKLAPMYQKYFLDYSTEGMAVSVMEILVLCILICLITIWSNFYGLWIGCFIAFAIHLVMHFAQAIVWRGYIPAIATAVIVLPISLWVIVECIEILGFGVGQVVLWSAIGLVIIAINLKCAHALMHWYTKKMCIKNVD